MMKHLMFILILSSFPQSNAQSNGEIGGFYLDQNEGSGKICDLDKEGKEAILNNVLNSYGKIRRSVLMGISYNVEAEINETELILNRHCLTQSDVGLPENGLNQLRVESRLRHIENKSMFQDVSRDITNIRKEIRENKIETSRISTKALRIIGKLNGLAEVSKKNQLKEQEKCQPEIDLSSKFKDVPTRDQGSNGWCFAYAISDLITAQTGKPISAVDIALRYFKKVKSNNWNVPRSEKEGPWQFDSGYLGFLKEIMDQKVCLEADVKSSGDSSTKDIGDLLFRIQNFKLKYDQSFRDSFGQESYHSREEKKKYLMEEKLCKSALSSVFPKLEIKDILDVLEHSSTWSYLEELRDKSCTSRVDLKDFRATFLQGSKHKQYNQIDKWLNGGKTVGLDFMSSFLKEKGVYLPASAHSALIIGRKYNKEKKSCEYLVRNSWGKNCSVYKESGITCDPETGYIYLSKEELFPSIYSVWTVDKK